MQFIKARLLWLKGFLDRKKFSLVFSENFLTNLKINFTKFGLSTTFRLQDMTI